MSFSFSSFSSDESKAGMFDRFAVMNTPSHYELVVWQSIRRPAGCQGCAVRSSKDRS
jgi:hypothetical protein